MSPPKKSSSPPKASKAESEKPARLKSPPPRVFSPSSNDEDSDMISEDKSAQGDPNYTSSSMEDLSRHLEETNRMYLEEQALEEEMEAIHLNENTMTERSFDVPMASPRRVLEEAKEDYDDEAEDDDVSIDGRIPTVKLDLGASDIQVDECFSKLREGQYLNDEIINFMLSMFTAAFIAPGDQTKVILNTYIYEQLINPAYYPDQRIMKVLRKKLTAKTRFIIMPINLSRIQHWTLAIFGNVDLGMQQEQDGLTVADKAGNPCPFFLYLDSLGRIDVDTRKGLNRMCELIMAFKGEQRESESKDPDEPQYFPYYAYRLNIPKQQNTYDCGIFILEYAARFLNNPALLLDPSTYGGTREPIAFMGHTDLELFCFSSRHMAMQGSAIDEQEVQKELIKFQPNL